MSSEITGAEVEKLAALTEDELFELLGEAFHGSFPGDQSRRGWKFFRTIATSSREAICSNAAVRRYIADDNKIAAMTAIADLLLAKYGHTAAVTAAVLIVKMGLGEFCASVWAAGGDGD
jgi:hypothetical protein